MAMSEYEMTLEYEQQPKEVEQLVLCDLDRALIKSDELVDVVRDYLLESGNMTDEQHAALIHLVADIHDNAGSAVQPYQEMRSEFGLEAAPDVLVDEVIEHFGIEELKDRVLVPGADELFQALEQKDIEHAILTSAGDDVGQQFKIHLFERMVGQDGIPYWIINHETKATTAEEHWFNDESNEFEIPAPDNSVNAGWVAKRLCLIDDKTKNLVTSTPRDDIVPIHVYADDIPTSDGVSVREVAEAVMVGEDLNNLRWQVDRAA